MPVAFEAVLQLPAAQWWWGSGSVSSDLCCSADVRSYHYAGCWCQSSETSWGFLSLWMTSSGISLLNCERNYEDFKEYCLTHDFREPSHKFLPKEIETMWPFCLLYPPKICNPVVNVTPTRQKTREKSQT